MALVAKLLYWVNYYIEARLTNKFWGKICTSSINMYNACKL